LNDCAGLAPRDVSNQVTKRMFSLSQRLLLANILEVEKREIQTEGGGQGVRESE